MSKYTTEVRWICESSAGFVNPNGFNSIENILNAAAPMVFNFYFPIFDENYRLTLEKKILAHYYTREINQETVGLWKMDLYTRLNEIMPYYNKLYESELLKFNPLYDTDYTEDYKGNGKQDTTEGEDKVSDYTGNHSAITDTKQDNTSTRTNDLTRTTDFTDGRTHDSTSNTDGTKTTDITETRNLKGSNNSTNTNSQGEWDLYADTPQGDLDNVLSYGGLHGSDGSQPRYLTNARHTFGDGGANTTNGSTSDTGTVNTGGDETVKNKDVVNEQWGGTTKNVQADTGETVVKDDRTGKTSLTEGSTSKNSDSRNLNRAVNTIDDYIRHVAGKRGTVSYSKLIQEFRDTFLNIDMMIINDLSDLFFGLWQ